MAKRHIITLIGWLAARYSKAQAYYEKVAEIFSEDMIDPEVYTSFTEIKKNLDAALYLKSSLFESALNSKEFAKIREKRRDFYNDFKKVYDTLVEQEATHLLDAYKRKLSELTYVLDETLAVSKVLGYPNSKKKYNYLLKNTKGDPLHVVNFSKIDQYLIELENFIKDL